MSPSPKLRVVPLGGLGEIGMNCMALEVGDDIIVVDCGVTFPRSDLGIDTFHPDFTWLEQRRERIRALVLTHGHEDHIGAVPYFAARFDVPIWGPPYALELARLRLEEHGFKQGKVNLVPTELRRRFAVKGFEIEPLRVTHSIAEATALVLRTAAGTVVHTGDFKLDPSPGDGQLTDEEGFAAVGDEGVRLLLSDSTNADNAGSSGSEADARESLRRLVDGHTGRVIVGLFASNVARLRAIGEVARETGRRLVLYGRSVHTHTRVARDRGLLSWPSDLVIPAEHAASVPRRQLLGVATGTQAERLAALYRLSTRNHPGLALDPGDRVIFSSRVIPGNEPMVQQMINGFLRQGVEVRTPINSPGVHVSGHAGREEQARMIDLVKPDAFVPIHGTLSHLFRHAELARERGVREVLVIENGEIASVSRDPIFKEREPFLVGKIPTFDGEEIPAQVIADREAIARSGIAFVTVLVDVWGRPAGPCSLATRGVLDEIKDAQVVRDTMKEVTRALTERPWSVERPGDEDVAEVARSAARRKLEQAVGKRPVTIAIVVRVRA